MKTLFGLTLASSACLLSSLSCAQPGQVTSPLTEQPRPTEMVVSANRFSQATAESLNAVSIINREQIRLSAATSLFDVLRGQPGLQLARTGVEGAQTSLFMRGSNSNHTLILLDGVRLNTASEGAARLENIPVENIERIEVVRGPQSSVYGADAIGGVIQIFTRDQTGESTSQALRSDISAGAGTQNSRTLNAGLTLQQGDTVLRLDAGRLQTDGIPARNAPTFSTQKADYDRDNASINLRHMFSPQHSVWATWHGSQAEKNYDGGFSESDSRSIAVGSSHQLHNSWISRLQLNRFKDDNHTRSWADSRSMTRRDSLQWQNELSWINNGQTLAGVDIDQDELLYLNPGAVQNRSQRNNRAAFVVHQQSFAATSATVSLRRDHNQQFGGHTTGRAAIGYDLTPQFKVWAAAGTAYKAPTLVDLYVDFPDFWFFANPALKPERARNLEIGLQAIVWQTELALNVFRNDIRDLIGSSADFSTLTNISRARINGMELSARRELLGWQNELALTLLDHEDRNTGLRLLRRPDETLNLKSSRRFGGLTVQLDWQLTGARADLDPVTYSRSRVVGYGVLDTALMWQHASGFTTQLKIGNLFDNNYEVVDGYNTLGRHGMLTLRRAF